MALKTVRFSPLFHFLLGLVFYISCDVTWRWLRFSLSEQQSPNHEVNEANLTDTLREGSSFWCIGHNKSTRICKFRNLCYHPVYDEFLFFHGPETILDGVPDNRFDPALLDLSSVDDHNTQYFNFVDYPVEAAFSFSNVTFVAEFSLIFRRFNPDNLMHVLHDDILPLYHTIRQFSRSMFSFDLGFRLVMMEGWDEGANFHLYKLLTSKSPILKKDLQREDHLTCFLNGVVGISKYTTWYQYGFKQPQGPLPSTLLTGSYVQQFQGFIKGRLHLNNTPSQFSDSPYVVLCSREHNRLITNELDLSLAVARKLNKRVVRVSMATHSFKEQVNLISHAGALIGMHGSILIMAMFLPQGAQLIELYPFGINPDRYTPYRTLAELPGMNIMYESWRNEIESNSVTYPDERPELGGIAHLTPEEQVAVINTKEVPPHLCCNNPYWLYRIYQDTSVDIPSLLISLESANLKKEMFWRKKESTKPCHKLYPSKVINVTCNIPSGVKPTLWLSWKPPLNFYFFTGCEVKYEVWIQEAKREDYVAYILHLTEYLFTENLQRDMQYNVWVRCLVNEQPGPFGKVAHCRT